jgi:hypothetical protein
LGAPAALVPTRVSVFGPAFAKLTQLVIQLVDGRVGLGGSLLPLLVLGAEQIGNSFGKGRSFGSRPLRLAKLSSQHQLEP